MDKYLNETVDKFDKEATKMISHDNNKPIGSGRDISLLSIIIIYKERLN